MARGRLRRGCSLEVILEEDGDLMDTMNRAHSVDSLDSLEYTASERNPSPSLWRIKIGDEVGRTPGGGCRRARSLDWLVCNGDMDMNCSPWDLNGSSYEEELDVDITPDDSTNCSVSPRLEEDSPAARARISRRQIASTWSDRDSPWFVDPPNADSEDGASNDSELGLSGIQQMKSMFEARVKRSQLRAFNCRHGSLDRSRNHSNHIPAVHYLADYDIPDLLLNNNVVIVESRPSRVASRNNQNKQVSVGGFWPPPGVTGAVFRVGKKSADVVTSEGAKTVPRTIGWRPSRLRNKELVDTELPKPDTVKTVRSVFEKILVFDRKDESSEGEAPPPLAVKNKMTAVKSNPRSKILRSDSFERRNRPEKFANIHNMISQIKPRPPPQLYVKVVKKPQEVMKVQGIAAATIKPPGCQPRNLLSKTFSCPSLVSRHHHKRQTTTSDEDDSPSDDEETPKYIPQEVLERIRACGTSVTYFGGRVVSAASKSSLRTLDIVEEIHKGNVGDTSSLPLRKSTVGGSNIRANLNNILNNYATLPRMGEANAPRIVSVVPKPVTDGRSRQVAPLRTSEFSDSEDDERESSQSPERFSSSPSPAFSSSCSSSPTLVRDRVISSNLRANMAPKFGQHSVIFNFTGASPIKSHVPQRHSEEDDDDDDMEEAWF